MPVVLAGAFLLVGLRLGVEDFLQLGGIATLMAVTLVGVVRFGPQLILILLLVAGYFAGWMKMRYGWLGYAIPDALCIFLIGAAVFRGDRDLRPFPPSALSASVLLLTAFCLAELLNPEAPLVRSCAGFRSWILYTWLVFAGYHMLRSPRQLRQVYVVMLILSVVTALYGLYQWRQGPAAIRGQSEVLNEYAETIGIHGRAAPVSGQPSRVFPP